MPRYWMISDRNVVGKDELGKRRAGLTYWVTDKTALHQLASWDKVSERDFKAQLLNATKDFPPITDPERNEDQAHVAFFIHGYNNDWADAATRYRKIQDTLFSKDEKLGFSILFSWPSDGMKVAYLPDREDARRCAPDLADVFSTLYDWLLERQEIAARDPERACRAKLSVIAHSMGNYVLQKAMQLVWTRKNQPLLVSLINQLLMVAADVDNDLFGSGERTEKTDGDAIANLSYRVTALYSGLDSVLGMSAGLKHFGKRRLGRSGLDRTVPRPDNVWDVDCTPFFTNDKDSIHSAYFEVPGTIELMRKMLRGVDRRQIVTDQASAIG